MVPFKDIEFCITTFNGLHYGDHFLFLRYKERYRYMATGSYAYCKRMLTKDAEHELWKDYWWAWGIKDSTVLDFAKKQRYIPIIEFRK